MYNDVYDVDRAAYLYSTMRKWLDLKLKGGSIGEKLAETGIKSIAIYGAGQSGEEILQDIDCSIVNPLCFIDNNAEQYKNGMDGIAVITPQEYYTNPVGDIVLVMPEYDFLHIAENLIKNGIKAEHIVSLAMVI